MHQDLKKEMDKSHEYLTCPFCLKQCIGAEPGKTQCPACNATFEIDDRVECVFADTEISGCQLMASYVVLVDLSKVLTGKVVCTAGPGSTGRFIESSKCQKIVSCDWAFWPDYFKISNC